MNTNELPKQISNELYYRAYVEHAYDPRRNGYAIKRLNGNVTESDEEIIIDVNALDYEDYLEFQRIHGGSYYEDYPITHTIASSDKEGRINLIFTK
jgi:hypothetical protein